MSVDHHSYEEIAHERRGSAEYREGYAEAWRALLLGQVVRERRLTLGLSQTELAAPRRHDPARSVSVGSRWFRADDPGCWSASRRVWTLISS